MNLPYKIPNPRGEGYRPLTVVAVHGRWRVISNGSAYIVHDGPDSAIHPGDFRRGFGTQQIAEDRAYSADAADKRANK